MRGLKFFRWQTRSTKITADIQRIRSKHVLKHTATLHLADLSMPYFAVPEYINHILGPEVWS